MCNIGKIIKQNRIKCKVCGDVIESKSVYDFVTCSCKRCYVDGGKSYVQVGAFDLKDVVVLTEYENNKRQGDSLTDIPQERSKRERAMRIASAIGSIEGVPVSDETEQLYQKWVNGEMTENQLI